MGILHDEDGSATTEWTGEKKRKTILSSPLSEDATTEAMDIQLPETHGGNLGVEHNLQEDTGSVFSALDDVSLEEEHRLWKKLQSRERHSFRQISDEEACKMFDRIHELRLMEYRSKISKLSDHEDTAPDQQVDLDWEDRRVPSQTFDWTIFRGHFADRDLDVYQRIVLKREYCDEYWNFGEYCNTFSSYEIDEEYIKYWGELTKKIKWIKEYMHLKHSEIRDVDLKGGRQAAKIAADFSHLPSSLAIRGFEMSFKEAFNLSNNMLFPRKRSASVDLAFQQDIEIFRKQIPENASEDEVKDSFAFMVDNKKLFAPDDGIGVHCLVTDQEVEPGSA
ncbi:hypothetical protein EJB05_53043 [Eragrostis curvula]|uniref:Uncharacterized protein n=1 Tax=Eragrostis curvula TaxID=38414 RepID=A0A5J9SR64_9POAL|nr:hypothetical protein EJB05_53043 [Eragrostis curvula]